MKKKDADRIADFVWTRLLNLDAEETAGSDHMDWNAFNEWLLANIAYWERDNPAPRKFPVK